MSRRIIPVADLSAVPVISGPVQAPSGALHDALARPLRDLRISVTDRCNFRCVYCMPRAVFDKDYAFLPHSALLSFEEIERLARLFVAHGVEKIRLTGGEPLLRKNLEFLIDRLAQLTTPEGRPLDLTLTTNGSLLERKARSLKDAGLTRVTVSLDALDDTLFRRMNDADFAVADVLDGIAAAQAAGLAPVKVNMVVKRGTNDSEIVPMARHFKDSGAVLRFIEYMDVGTSNGWNMTEVLPSADVVTRIAEHFPLMPLEAHSAAETAQRWGYADGSGEIGVISSVTRAFCGSCTRARLSTEGKLYLCLFASSGHDLRALLRGGASDADIATAVAEIWQGRSDRYSQLRGSSAAASRTQDARRVEMSYIGG
ncbi:cyclic pyranopterin phosphate synthase MoaA [Paraburkholderia caffeinilytica]|uniref:GTP 3',8-cyclase n=1 Tax=Paraburkholderia caffeinilytica TaxID=1761016 RepID=A0ABQ1L5G5_9BURK|nr:GTP 3',8-cyclase MoaA [Paraburkholderia caffeinilytica]AXL51591.1 cyclic pyranopterin phosphate synthase MoaA [Paraburkholderia caffeinilytica]GGC19661.1 cyclic pyranopterin monophosphate synthase [Paraburkholderia caffeinilytica]CAB3808558.1 GTP 3',8-cyclase [Paraburkholderia caffeinilytica]